MHYMYEIYSNIDLLMYLRYHPRWYKILYYDPSMLNVFINEAKTNLKIRNVDKLENIKNKFNLLYSLSGLFNVEKK